jgi:hypothetical protein
VGAGMSNQQILEKAIQKAINGGWENNTAFYDYQSRGISDEALLGELIFNQNFAKALWGENNGWSCDMANCPSKDCACGKAKYWQHHLQQMVIAKDPIKYLGENI